MMGQRYRIELSEEERKRVQEIINGAATRKRRKARERHKILKKVNIFSLIICFSDFVFTLLSPL